jgi:DNA-binding transcriptional LysR family regulator
MDLKRLSTFALVAEQGTVSKAAQVLRITQPALSRQISSLEHDLGFPLFERVGRRLLLTPRGEQFLGYCRDLLAFASELNDKAGALRRGDIQVLRVAASSEPIEALFPTFLHRYARQHPKVQLALVEADAADHLTLLEKGEVHLAASVTNVLQVDAQRFATYALPRFHVAAAFSPSLRIAQGDAIDIGKLAEQPLLLPRGVFVTRILFDAACRLAGVKPQAFIESMSAHALLALAEEEHGVAVVPSIVRTAHRRLRVARVTHKREPLRIAPAIIWDRRRTLPRYAEDFSRLLATHILETFPSTQPAACGGPPRRGND